MVQGIGRPATALMMCLLGFPPAFALDRPIRSRALRAVGSPR
jgi:hypothetical protein